MKGVFAPGAKKGKEEAIYVLCGLSLLAIVLVRTVGMKPQRIKEEMLEASTLMNAAIEKIGLCREAKGLTMDRKADINGTGLIGLEMSAITTSLGNLGAKRTTTNPDFAGLVVYLLSEAGVRKGDTVAVGASGSFPALIVATLSAARTMGLRTRLICSLGASQWGANDPDFNWLDIEACLLAAGIINVRPVALSLGGAGDEGRDMSPQGRALLTEEAQKSGTYFLSEPSLGENVEERLRLFGVTSGREKVKAFVNIGGGYADMGTDSEILHVTPGLAVFRRLPPPGKRGVIFEMAARKIPVIHLLYIKGLCERYGLPWDPVPLPRPGQGAVYRRRAVSAFPFLVIAGVYFSLVAATLFLSSRDGHRHDALVGL
jgi:poly-gamma-glutamate system protein